MVNETGLWRLIDERIRNMGFVPGEVELQVFCVDIVSYHRSIDSGQNTVVPVNSESDMPYTAQVFLDTGNNQPRTSRSDYEKLSYAQY